MSVAPPTSYARALGADQRCRVLIADVATGATEAVYESRDILFEAPNWSLDGDLILNGAGLLWRLTPTAGETPRRIPLDGVPELNNDHVLDPDGAHVYVSANDWHIYRAPLTGGRVRRVTAEHGRRMHFLHGVSPDGEKLAYIAITPVGDEFFGAAGHVHTVSIDGLQDTALTSGTKPSDGSEYSPDGRWIYFNTEIFSETPGHAQIARMRPDGRDLEQLTFDERVNWFPHLAPTGTHAVYLSYPPGTVGHPADLPVQLRIVRDGVWADAAVLAELFGGQGTINVNSWSPDGRRFAYVDYPVGEDSTL
ncbi:MAG: hypothetical protein ABWY26_00560 [Microbacterium sp.]